MGDSFNLPAQIWGLGFSRASGGQRGIGSVSSDGLGRTAFILDSQGATCGILGFGQDTAEPWVFGCSCGAGSFSRIHLFPTRGTMGNPGTEQERSGKAIAWVGLRLMSFKAIGALFGPFLAIPGRLVVFICQCHPFSLSQKDTCGHGVLPRTRSMPTSPTCTSPSLGMRAPDSSLEPPAGWRPKPTLCLGLFSSFFLDFLAVVVRFVPKV